MHHSSLPGFNASDCCGERQNKVRSWPNAASPRPHTSFHAPPGFCPFAIEQSADRDCLLSGTPCALEELAFELDRFGLRAARTQRSKRADEHGQRTARLAATSGPRVGANIANFCTRVW